MSLISDLIEKYGPDAIEDALSSGKEKAGEAFNPPSLKIGENPASPEDFSQLATAQNAPKTTPLDNSSAYDPDLLKEQLAAGQSKLPMTSPADQSAQVFEQHPEPNFQMQGKPYSMPTEDTTPPISGLPAVQTPQNKGFYQGESGVPSTEVNSGVRDVSEKPPTTWEEMIQAAKENKLPASLGIAGTAAGASMMGTPQDQMQRPPLTKQSPVEASGMNAVGLGQYNDAGSDQPPVPLKGIPGPMQSSDTSAPEDESDEEGNINAPAKKASGLSVPSSKAPQAPVGLPQSQNLASLLATDKNQQSYDDIKKRSDLATLGNQLGAAGDIIGNAIAFRQPNAAAQKQFGEQAASAANMPKEFAQKQAMDEQDPNSAVSKNYRDFLAKQGLTVGPGVTAAQVREVLLPAVDKEKLQQERLQNAKDTKALGMTQINAYRALQQDNKDRADAEKNDFKDRTEGAQVAKEMNGLSSTSRSALGQATTAKVQAQRLKQLLSDPSVSNPDLNTAAALMNRIESGTATMGGAKDQQYHTLQQQLASGISYITGNPTAPDVPKIKQHMIDVADRMSKISDDVQNHQLAIVKAGHADFFKRRPEVVNGIIQAIQGDGSPAPVPGQQNSPAGNTNLPHQGKYLPGSTVLIHGKPAIVGADGDSYNFI